MEVEPNGLELAELQLELIEKTRGDRERHED